MKIETFKKAEDLLSKIEDTQSTITNIGEMLDTQGDVLASIEIGNNIMGVDCEDIKPALKKHRKSLKKEMKSYQKKFAAL